MPSSDQAIVIVLAAGRGTRMGGPKARMQVRGRLWWEHQIDALQTAGLESLWAVAPECEAALAPIAHRLVRCDGHAPMFDSAIACLRHAQQRPPDRVCVLPVDVPVPETATWSTLLACRDPLVAPCHEGNRGHPLCIAWQLCDSLLCQVDSGTLPPDQLRLDRCFGRDPVDLQVPDPRVCVNLNTPEQLRSWLERPDDPAP